ncbi:hypothetical protein [Streptomyces sp. NPDC029721]|uniref:hypothetical protein n=1 Tax=Streptomyces sp. NPDC029721 TaxID=3157090 RepID=UPI0033D3E35E
MAGSGVPVIGSVDELMELLHARHGGPRTPDRDLGLRTAALLRRSHPYDKELQVAGLVHGLGGLPGAEAAEAVRALLGDRVARLLRGRTAAGEDAEALRQAADGGAGRGARGGLASGARTRRGGGLSTLTPGLVRKDDGPAPVPPHAGTGADPWGTATSWRARSP